MKKIKIYGERNTGTNYLSELIRLNMEVSLVPGVVPQNVARLQKKVWGREWLKDIYFHLTYRQNFGWKHMKIPSKGINPNLLYDVVFITLTKNPYSWLLSLYKRPYHFNITKEMSFFEFIQTEYRTVGRENMYFHKVTPIDLWNIKNNSYYNLPSKKTFFLKTEDLLQNPADIIEEISIRFHLPRKNESIFKNFHKSTKNDNMTSSDYKVYYLQEKWIASLDQNSINYINKHIDTNLMKAFNYRML